MPKLKKILSYKLFYLVTLLVMISLVFYKFNEEIPEIKDNNHICTIENINLSSEKAVLLLNCGYKANAYYYFPKGYVFDLKLGDIVEVEGSMEIIDENTNFNIFDYKLYERIRNIYYNIDISSLKKVGESNDFIYKIKNLFLHRIEGVKGESYLKAFLIGDKSDIKEDVKMYKYLGIVHLFALSGMHVSLVVGFINKIWPRDNYLKNIFILLCLFLYYKLSSSFSLLRTIVYYLVSKLKINKYQKIYLSIMILVFINPLLLFDVGMEYSIVVSSFILIYIDNIKRKDNYLKKVLSVSILAFLASFPITVYYSSEINLLSILYNVLAVPIVSLIIYPFSLITFIFPFLDFLFVFVINSFNSIFSFFYSINSSVILIKPSLFIVCLYYFIICLVLKNKKYIYLFLIILFFHYNYNALVEGTYIILIDVGQGDSILIHHNNKNILLDTGGKVNSSSSIVQNITIPLLKSLGIRKLNYMIITHGDFDHMGEAINLVDNFKVDRVIFNNDEYNDLETKLINVLEKKKISYYKNVKELSVLDGKLYFLNTGIYDNENDNSNVIYTSIKGNKLLFMGDAGVEKERDILDKYNLKDIDFLKVGHHGSDTSSSKEFINVINPKYSLISVGRNNRYGHPKDMVLDNLSSSKIYRTDLDGSIEIKLNNKGYKIRTCGP